MENENLFNLIWGIIKAVLWFIFRILLLGPMILITVVIALLGDSASNVGEAIWKCICQPFRALSDAIKSISYEIKVYTQNK